MSLRPRSTFLFQNHAVSPDGVWRKDSCTFGSGPLDENSGPTDWTYHSFHRVLCSRSCGNQDAAILSVRRHCQHSIQDGVQWSGYVHGIPYYLAHNTVKTASRMESNGLGMYMAYPAHTTVNTASRMASNVLGMYMAYPAHTTVNTTSRMESNGLGMCMAYPAHTTVNATSRKESNGLGE